MQWIESRGKTMPIIGQPTAMECWITCYQMMFKGSGVQWNAAQIEQKLIAGGFANARNARVTGIGDDELLKCAQALGLGTKKTRDLNSLATVKMMLQLHGPLWIAGKFKGNDNGRYKHVVMAIGVDEELNRVGIVNPWQENMFDTPTIGWMHWNNFRNAIIGTSNIEGSVQYLDAIRAFNIKNVDKLKAETAKSHMAVYVGKI